VTRFFPSEYGTDVAYNASSAHEKPHQGKLKVRAYIKELQEKNPGKLEYTYVVVGPFSDWFLGKMLLGREEAGGFDVQAKKAVLLGSGKEKFSFTAMAE
jgi:NmrA-like family